MGFFSKIFKGIKKVVKKIGKGIKSAVKKVGKVVGKLGVVGQIGLMFVLPGVGGALAKGFGALTKGLLANTGTGILGAAARGIGHVLATAGKFASTVGNAFSSVTDAIGGFVKNVGGKMLEKVGLKSATEGTLSEAFQTWMNDSVKSFGEVLDPFKQTNEAFAQSLIPKPTEATASMTAEDVSVVETSADKAVKAAGPAPSKETYMQEFQRAAEVSEEIAAASDASKGEGLLGFLDKDFEFLGAEFNVADEVRNQVTGMAKKAIGGLVAGEQDQEDYTPRGTPQYSAPNPIQMAQDIYNQNGLNYGSTPYTRFGYTQTPSVQSTIDVYAQSLRQGTQSLRPVRG